jgi:flagellar hook-basal body complex protein FliE
MEERTKKALLISGGIAFVATVAIGLGALSKSKDKPSAKKAPKSEDTREDTPGSRSIINTIEQNCTMVNNLLVEGRDFTKQQLGQLLVRVGQTLEQNSKLLASLRNMKSKSVARLVQLCQTIDVVYHKAVIKYDGLPDDVAKTPHNQPQPQRSPTNENDAPAPTAEVTESSALAETQELADSANSTTEGKQNNTVSADDLLTAIKKAEAELQTLTDSGEHPDSDHYKAVYQKVEDAYTAYDSAVADGKVKP